MGRTRHAGSACHPPLLILSLCFKGRAARGWDSLTPTWALEPSATLSLEPHLGFLLIFKDDILGPRRRMGKDGVIRKLGVGLHYP